MVGKIPNRLDTQYLTDHEVQHCWHFTYLFTLGILFYWASLFRASFTWIGLCQWGAPCLAQLLSISAPSWSGPCGNEAASGLRSITWVFFFLQGLLDPVSVCFF